jgi:ABC-type multidrug transport system fused ATPase/permease subunit
MDKGRMVECGSHQALLAANGTYARLLASGSGVLAKETTDANAA